MKTQILIALCLALSLCAEVYAEGEQEVKRGLYPYMAFLYYPDESIVDGTGARFLRGAVLIRPEWLVTSAVGPSVVTDNPNGFPRKTLLARLGAVAIDTNYTLNEDEDEQEREVIQIVRPYNHSATQWWRTDISLMKTLLPFNLTSAVGIAHLSPKQKDFEKTCSILVFAKKDGNWTEERNLMQLNVELLPPSIQNCGSHFVGTTMTCTSDSDENKNAENNVNFCQGNSGGPLICENEVVAIQTYIDNDCKAPHLYQLLSAWDNFITCGTENKCQEEECANTCDVANKDPPVINIGITSTVKTNSHLMHATTSTAVQIVTSTTPDTTSEELDITTGGTMQSSTLEDSITTDIPPTAQETSSSHAISEVETTETKSWPSEKYRDDRKKLEQGDLENPVRKPSVEAQQHDIKKKSHSAKRSSLSNSLTLFFGFFILACLI